MNSWSQLLPLISIGLLTVAAVAVAPPSACAQDMSVTLPDSGQTVRIDPLPVLSARAQGKLAEGTPSWRGPYRLPKVAWIFRALKPGSLKVRVADGGRELVEGSDYLLDPDWAALAVAPGSKYPAGTPLEFEYQYTLSRLDLVERTPEGALRVIKGQEDMATPRLPKTSAGCTAVAGVYLPHNTLALTQRNVNLIDTQYKGVAPVINVEQLASLKQRMASGKPTVIVFFGDSITAMGQKDLGEEGNFVDRFTRWLGGRYPSCQVVSTGRDSPLAAAEKQIVIVKSGVGGNDTRAGLARMQRDVLSHQPNLVVIMFGVNDENCDGPGKPNVVPVAAYRANLQQMVQKVREAGAIPLLMTTSMKNRQWVATAGNLGEYATAARELSQEHRVALIDNYAAWENLPRTGYDYMVFLGSCINHPVGLGHELFFSGLQAAFAE